MQVKTFDVYVKVSEWGHETERELKRIGTITGKNRSLHLYSLRIDARGDTDLEMGEEYLKLLSELLKANYITDLQTFLSVPLTGNKMRLDLGSRLAVEQAGYA